MIGIGVYAYKESTSDLNEYMLGGRKLHPAVAALLSTRALMVKDQGDLTTARRLLERAIEMDAKNRVHAFWDPDFAEVREDPELGAIFEC